MFIVSLIIVQVIIFAGLIIVFRGIMTKNVVLATRHLEELNKDSLAKEKELNRQLEEARQKTDELIASAQDEAEKLKSEIIKNAQEEKDKILTQARTNSEELIQQADKSRQRLLSEIDERIAKESINKACELVEDSLPGEFKQLVHGHWVEDLIESGFSKLERLRIPKDIEEVKIASAFALNDEQRKKISKKLKDSLGRQIKVKEQVDPKVVVGLVITIGSLVLDGSLKNKIREKAR